MTDRSGELANTIVGLVVGGLVGGTISALKGESFWAGAAQGAVSGAIAGAVVDAVLLSGGVAFAAVPMGIAFFGGFAGNIAGEAVYNKIVSGGGTSFSLNREIVLRSAIAGVFNMLSLGISSLLLGGSMQAIDLIRFSEYDIVSAFYTLHFAIDAAMVMVAI